MKKLLIPFFMVIGILSCDNSTITIDSSLDKSTKQESGSDNAVSTSTNLDTLSTMPDDLISRVNRTQHLPYLVDKKKIEDLDHSENGLSPEEVALLTEHLIDNEDFGFIKYRMESYFSFHDLIDSIGEEAYMEQIDLGMTTLCDAYLNEKVIISENRSLLIWSLDYSTYLACPFYSGIYVLATMCVDGKVSHTVFIGESSGGGDAPVWSSIEMSSTITQETIDVVFYEEVGGMDDEDELATDVTRNKCRYLITSMGIELEK